MIRLLLLLLSVLVAQAHADRYWLFGHGSTRVLSMGGCYTANTRAAEARQYNPAGLRLRRADTYWSLAVDPAALLAVDKVEGGDSPYADALPGLLALRGIWLGNETIALALHPADHIPSADSLLPADPEERVLRRQDVTPSATLSWALDSRISLGMSGAYRWSESHRNRRLSVSYGLLVRLNSKVDVGAVAVNLGSEDASSDRRWLDRVDDGTINVGLSWFPFGRRHEPEAGRHPMAPDMASLQLSCDVRNVTQEGRGFNSQEVHLGAALAWPGLLELRGGIYWPQDPDFPRASPVRSLGLGLLRGGQRSFSKRLLPFHTLLDLGWMDNPLSQDREGLFMAGIHLGF